ncbi:MAG: MarR family winged helix-turn-helix transcriptional regulator [Thiohalomonadales bacterium]
MSAKQLILSLCGLQSQLIRQIDQCLFVHGISYSEYLVLLHLHGMTDKGMRRIDLAEQIGLSASGVTRLLNPMEKNHLVKKESNPRDARVSLVQLTKTGEQILLEASVSFDYTAEKILVSLSPTKVNRLAALIDEIKN